VYSGPEQVGPIRMSFATPSETVQTWTFPKASGYFLSEDEYRDFKAMQAWWSTREETP